MGETNKKISDKRLKRIRRGEYWFGIFGRMAMLLGFLSLSVAIIGLIFKMEQDIAWRSLERAITLLLFGWLFLKGRNVFEAIAYLIEEKDQIVD